MNKYLWWPLMDFARKILPLAFQVLQPIYRSPGGHRQTIKTLCVAFVPFYVSLILGIQQIFNLALCNNSIFAYIEKT